MSDPAFIALVTATPGILTAFGVMANIFITLAQKKTIKDLEKNTNSIKDALVKVTGESEFARGLKEGKEKQ